MYVKIENWLFSHLDGWVTYLQPICENYGEDDEDDNT